jgi:crotonobetainyl-CoA:carnitine CoA-transferase CaiB-like acyl-CoA transferase
MSPGAIERLGLGYEELRAINPRLIFASVTGYGQDGPWAGRNGVDAMVQALSGTMSITGEPEGPPVRVGFSIADLAAGMFLAIGVLAAINERHETGLGQSLDVSLLEAMMSLTENAIARYLYTGTVPTRQGSAHPYNKLTGAYETRDGWMVAALSARNWKAAVPVLGRPEWLEDPELQSRPEENADRLLPEVRAILRENTMAFWTERLGAAGVLCMPINSVAEAVRLPPIIERGFIQETVNSEGRHVNVAGSPLRLSRTPARVRTAAPLLGEHTRLALASWLGIADPEFSELEAAGVFQTVERETRGFW